MVALAILMPIVASMSGNAGIQAMTVTIRAIATRDIAAKAALRAIGREIMVGLINGLAVAVCGRARRRVLVRQRRPSAW